MPLADTYVENISPSSSRGQESFHKVADSAVELSLTYLMFNLSGVLQGSDASLEAKLRLRSLYVTSPHVIGVHWCVNNTWDEHTLTSINGGRFVRTKPESIIWITSENVWHEWSVTGFVSAAIRQNYEEITLVLEAEETVKGNAFVLFYSKDQQDLPPNEYSPQLVLTYSSHGGVSLDSTGKAVLGVLAAVGIVFATYKFLKKPAKRRRRSPIK